MKDNICVMCGRPFLHNGEASICPSCTKTYFSDVPSFRSLEELREQLCGAPWNNPNCERILPAWLHWNRWLLQMGEHVPDDLMFRLNYFLSEVSCKDAAASLRELAAALQEQGRGGDAVFALEFAIDQIHHLEIFFEGCTDQSSGLLGDYYRELSLLLWDEGERGRAIFAMKEAIAHYKGLISAHTENLVQCFRELSKFALAVQDRKLAIMSLSKALPLAKSLSAKDPYYSVVVQALKEDMKQIKAPDMI